MLFNSVEYLIFLPVVTIVYFLLPKRIRYIWLLLASYYFYMHWNAGYGALIFSVTLASYTCGRIIEKTSILIQRIILGVGVASHILLLVVFKYLGLLEKTLAVFIDHHGSAFSFGEIMLPVGISFFTFQSIGYMVDVFRGDVGCEKNFLRYALFIAFFPQLVAGPIERASALLGQIREPVEFGEDNGRVGIFDIAHGLFMKIVLADNLAVIVDMVYSSYGSYGGNEIAFASILFALQIYCDFEGYTRIALGSARLLGFTLSENFRTPYFACSVRDFWRRWHMSLTSWFRDYLYIPLGGSRKGKVRAYLNLMIVFLLSGLWHGAAWHFAIWGGVNGLLCVIQNAFAKYVNKIQKKIRIDSEKIGFRFLQSLLTFLLVDAAWIFFRADSVHAAVSMMGSIVSDFRLGWFLNAEWVSLFKDIKILPVLMIGILILTVADYLKMKGTDVAGIILSQQVIVRWIVYFVFFLLVIYWGRYGADYEQKQFIYFQF